MQDSLLTPKKARLTKRWNPTKWQPEYDRVCAMSFLGLSNVAIAERTGFDKQHISNIINCDRGVQVIHDLQTRQKETVEKSIGERLNDVAEKFVKRLEVFVEDDELYTKSPFAVIDRGFRVLEGTRNLKDPKAGDTFTQNNIFSLPPEIASTLIAGLELSKKVKELHAGTDLNRDVSGLGEAGLISSPKKHEDAA